MTVLLHSYKTAFHMTPIQKQEQSHGVPCLLLFLIFLFQHFYFCLKILLLKLNLCHDLLGCHIHIFRHCHPFIFHIIEAVDDGDDFSCKFFYRVINAKNVDVLFLSVRGDDSFNVTIIYRIKRSLCSGWQVFIGRSITT